MTPAEIRAEIIDILGAIAPDEDLSSLTDDDHIILIPNRLPIVGKAANDASNGSVSTLPFRVSESRRYSSPVTPAVSGGIE